MLPLSPKHNGCVIVEVTVKSLSLIRTSGTEKIQGFEGTPICLTNTEYVPGVVTTNVLLV